MSFEFELVTSQPPAGRVSGLGAPLDLLKMRQLSHLTWQPSTVQPSQSFTKLLLAQGWQPVTNAHACFVFVVTQACFQACHWHRYKQYHSSMENLKVS